MENHTDNRTIPVNEAARLLRVPMAWLRNELEAGRLPGIEAGRTILVHLPTIETHLVDRAQTEKVPEMRLSNSSTV